MPQNSVLRFLCLSALICCSFSISSAQNKPMQPFHLSDVRLLDGPFKNAEQVDLKYIMALDPDKLLAPFQREAGLNPEAESYGNWESSGLDGHIGGHYLTALSLMYASTGNVQVYERLNYMIEALSKCQDENGYLGGIPGGKELWEEIRAGKIEADNFSLNQKWVPWYNIHKLYAGLRDAYYYAGNQQAKDMLIKLADWSFKLVARLDDNQIQQMLNTEYGGMNEAFADIAELTGDNKYLDLARKFSHRVVLDPLIDQKDQLTGMHANTQIPKVIGFKRIADLDRDETWNDASTFFWETVVENRTIAIGGNSVREHFHPANDFMPMIQDREGPETCNTYNMVKLSKMLYFSSANLKYIDFYERALYNHILSSQHPEKGGFVYFTPMRPAHYRVYSQPEKGFWCCVGSGMENHAKYGELIYAHSGDELFVNLFIPSQLNWKEKNVTLKQVTSFPEKGATDIIITSSKPSIFSLQIRHPEWINDNDLKVLINGKEEDNLSKSGSYYTIDRRWKSGDKVTVVLPMETRLEQLPDKSDYFAVLHGPIVLAAKTDTTGLEGLFADDSRMGHIAKGKLVPLQDAPLFVSEQNKLLDLIKPVPEMPLTFKASQLIRPEKFKDLTLIPFYKIHEARYVIYWQQATPEKLKEIQGKNLEDEKLKMEFEKRTVDQVAPGEQQPESDHFFKGEQTETGIFKDKHWRHSNKWFSYNLKDKNSEASTLQVTYYGLDKDRNFDILINDRKIATVALDGTRGDQFFTVDYAIPSDIVENNPDGILVTKFVAHKNSTAGGIYYVRLLK